MKNETLDVIQRRRSVRNYKAEQVTDAELQTVLEAGRCAPYVSQPAHITVVQNAALIARINTAAKEAAMHMAMPHLKQLGSNPQFVGSYGAPTIIIVSDREDSMAAEQGCSAAAQNMLIAAEVLGLGACWVHFPFFFLYSAEAEKIRTELKLPEGNKPCACIALGYKGVDAESGERVYSEITVIK